MWLLNVTGPGCLHFSTCQRCLRAQRFMGCGWCGDECRRRHECTGPWVQDSCPPVLTDVGLPSPCSSHLPSTRMGRDMAVGVARGGTPSLGWVLCSSEKGISGPSTVTGLWGLGVTQVLLPQFHPQSAPLRGRTRVTLCGMTFRSHLGPDPSHSPPGAYRVAVGQRGCTVLPEKSESYR